MTANWPNGPAFLDTAAGGCNISSSDSLARLSPLSKISLRKSDLKSPLTTTPSQPIGGLNEELKVRIIDF